MKKREGRGEGRRGVDLFLPSLPKLNKHFDFQIKNFIKLMDILLALIIKLSKQ